MAPTYARAASQRSSYSLLQAAVAQTTVARTPSEINGSCLGTVLGEFKTVCHDQLYTESGCETHDYHTTPAEQTWIPSHVSTTMNRSTPRRTTFHRATDSEVPPVRLPPDASVSIPQPAVSV